MSNLLLDPYNWKDYTTNQNPPAYWNDGAYVIFNGPETYAQEGMVYVGAAPEEGDTLEGSIHFYNTDGFGASLLYIVGGDVLGEVELISGFSSEFAFEASPSGGKLFISTGTLEAPSNFYGLTVNIQPTPEPPEPVVSLYNCECEDDYPRKTLAQLRRRLLVRLGYSAQADNPPPGMADLLDDFTVQAQELLYRKYAVFRTERFFTWDMEQGVRFYDLDDNSNECTKKLDPRKVTWVGVSLGDDQWQPIACGIDPSLYGTNINGIPERYEIRQCIEVWPAPSDDTWKLRVKGHFGLLPFEEDDDFTTIDSEAVFLLALANAKAHYQQPDAGNYVEQLKTYLGDLISGSHHTRRYLPGERTHRLRPVPRVKSE